MRTDKKEASRPAAPPRSGTQAELERLRAENEGLSEALRISEQVFSSFMENLPDRCILLDSGFRYRYLNPEALSSPAIDPRAGIGGPINVLRDGDPEGVLEEYREVLRSGRPLLKEKALRDEAGAERHFTIRAFKAGELLGLVWTDVTESRRSKDRLSATEAELRALAQHIFEVREEERKNVARELHDELGQALTAIELELRAMARVHQNLAEDQRKRIGDLLLTTNQSIRSVQRLCSELRPAVLDRLGLTAAIEWLAEGTASRYGLSTKVEVGVREAAIGPKAAIALFRITQESLTNVVRHARASSIEIELRDSGGAVALRVRDDGVGISEARAHAPGSFGIQGIRERARGLGGVVSIRGEPGLGTVLEVSIPFPADGRLP